MITGGLLVTPDGQRSAEILMQEGQIAALLAPGSAPSGVASILDATGCLVLPGAIDPHVHFREPGFSAKEDWEHGSLAAVAGGVTTVLDMPNTQPPTTTAAALRDKVTLIAGRSRCHYGLYGMLWAQNAEEIEALAEAGAIGLKVFLGETTASLPPPDDGQLLGALRRTAALGLRTAVHAENGAILRAAAVAGDGLAAHGRSRPAVAEAEAVRRVCLLAEATGAPILIVHVSTAWAVDILRRVKAEGRVNVRVETCPHYLLLTEDEAAPMGAIAKVNPPLRSAEDRSALWEAIADGTVDQLGSDHAPHTPSEKECVGDLYRAAAGFAGVQTLVPLLLTEVVAGRLGIGRLVELIAEGPARHWGLWPRKGRIAPGADADLAIVRLCPPAVLPRPFSKNPRSPLSDRPVHAEIVATLVAGQLAYRDGHPVGAPTGQWQRPNA